MSVRNEMADHDLRIPNPMSVRDNSPERVALELAFHIAQEEGGSRPRDRKYWLTLYRQCYKATHGASLLEILRH